VVEIVRADGSSRRRAPFRPFSVDCRQKQNRRLRAGWAYLRPVNPRGCRVDEAEALVNLESVAAPTIRVLAGPGWCGVLLHGAVGHSWKATSTRAPAAASGGVARLE
jgi:TldD protein